MSKNIKNYYLDAHTALGYYNLSNQATSDLKKIYILKGGPGAGKSVLMKKIGEKLFNKGYSIEFVHCSYDANLIEGVIIVDLKLGIFDNSICKFSKDKQKEIEIKEFDLYSALDTSKLDNLKNKIAQLKMDITEQFQLAHNYFNLALKIHDEWERIYLDNIDFMKLDSLAEKCNKLLIGDKSFNKKAIVKHRFFGAPTPSGSVDYINNLTEDIVKRYFIKGRPGSGKSTMLKKIAAEAEKRGIDVEVYHCAFDPNSIDMIAMRELDIVLFDSTAPHEYFPSRESDEIIDSYEEAVTSGTDERYKEELSDIIKRYDQKKKEALSYLAKAIEGQKELKGIYVEAMDFSKVEKIGDEILKSLDI